MKIGFVRVFVTDLERSLRFYTDTLGMEIDYTDNTGWVQFKSGDDVSLAIERCAADHEEFGSRVVGRFVGVTLIIERMSDTYAELSHKGIEFLGAPEKQSWGGTLVHLKDPDGNILTLMEEA